MSSNAEPMIKSYMYVQTMILAMAAENNHL